MMNTRFQFKVALLGPVILGMGPYSWSFVDDSETPQQLTLADLAGYRSALSGKATAEDAKAADPPARVVFKDLWNRPDLFRGRRVTVRGRIARILRQGSVGSFPPLAEVWIASPVGDPFCLVSPQERSAGIVPVTDHGPGSTGIFPVTDQGLEGRATPQTVPELGQTIRFTGTFLKLVRYSAKGGARLAPLVVGDRPPVPISNEAGSVRSPPAALRSWGGRLPNDSLERSAWSPASWALGQTLAALAAGVIVWQHLRAPSRRASVRHAAWRTTSRLVPDPPLEFIEPRDEP
jgi:hypothetical protein